jgi:hypothetical protein
MMDPALRSRMGAAGRANAADLTMDRHTAELEALLRRLATPTPEATMTGST